MVISPLMEEIERDEEKIPQRRDAALLRALSTPHKRQKEMKLGKKRGESERKDEPEEKGKET